MPACVKIDRLLFYLFFFWFITGGKLAKQAYRTTSGHSIYRDCLICGKASQSARDISAYIVQNPVKRIIFTSQHHNVLQGLPTNHVPGIASKQHSLKERV
jgi:hypothetical protein